MFHEQQLTLNFNSFQKMSREWGLEKRIYYTKALMKICGQCLEPFWTDKALANHLNKENHKATCYGCNGDMDHKNVSVHGNYCKKELECTNCGAVQRGKDILTHLETHSDAISCPLGCGKTFFSTRIYKRRVCTV